MEWIFWLILFTIAIAFQLRSAFTNTKWGMLTSSVRWLRERLWGRLFLFPLWFWLTMHWFVQDIIPGSELIWYPASILLGLVTAFLLDYDDYWKTMAGSSYIRNSGMRKRRGILEFFAKTNRFRK